MNSHAAAVFGRVLLGAILLFVASWVVSGTAGAQEPVRIGIDQIIVEGESLTAFVSVTDAEGRPVPGLTAFETALDGESVAPDSVATAVDEDVGIAVLMLIDVSGSMAGEPIAQARQAASLFVEQLAEHDSAAIVPFGGEAPSEAAFLVDRGVLLAELSALETEGNRGTALYDSVISAIEASQGAPTSRRALIILTDGQDFGTSTSGREDALSSAAGAGIPSYTIGLGDADLAFLSELADAGNGDFYHAPQASDTTRIFEAIGTTLRSQYVITVPFTATDREQRVLRVQLETQQGVIAAAASFDAPFAVSEGGSGVAPAVLAAGAAAAVFIIGGLGVVALLRRRRRWHDDRDAGRIGLPRIDGGGAVERGASAGVLRVIDGPNAGLQATLSEAAIEIGSATSCGLTLAEAGGQVASVHARVWLKNGRLMVHHVARKYQTYVGDGPVEWATLEPADTLRIGPHVIGFSAEAESQTFRGPLPQPSS